MLNQLPTDELALRLIEDECGNRLIDRVNFRSVGHVIASLRRRVESCIGSDQSKIPNGSAQDAVDGAQRLIPLIADADQSHAEGLVSESRVRVIATRVSAVGERKRRGPEKLAFCASGTSSERITRTMAVMRLFYIVSKALPHLADVSEIMASIREGRAPNTLALKSVCERIERAMEGRDARWQRGRREALAILLDLESLPDVSLAKGTRSRNRSAFGTIAEPTTAVPAIAASLFDEVDTQGLDEHCITRELISLAAEAAKPETPLDAAIDHLEYQRNLRAYQSLLAVGDSILRPWIEGERYALLPARADRGLGLGQDEIIHFEYPSSQTATNSESPLPSLNVVCAVVLKLLLDGYNLESVLNSRVIEGQLQTVIHGRKPRAGGARTPMKIEDSQLRAFFVRWRKNVCVAQRKQTAVPKTKINTLSYVDGTGWRQLTAYDFRRWFKNIAVPRLSDMTAMNYSSVRPMIAQLLAHSQSGELADAHRQLHHKKIEETVGYVDGLSQRIRLHRQASKCLFKVEANCLYGLPAAVLEALQLTPATVTDVYTRFSHKHAKQFDGTNSPYLNVGVAPFPAACRRAKGAAMPPPPVSHTAALWAICVSLLVSAKSFIEAPSATRQSQLSFVVALRHGKMATLECTPSELLEMVEAACGVLLRLSGLAPAEISDIANRDPVFVGGHWRLKWQENGKQQSRLVSASAAFAVSILKMFRQSASWQTLLDQRPAGPVFVKPPYRVLRRLCRLGGVADKWADRRHGAGSPLFSTGQLSKALPALWHVLAGVGGSSDTALAYLCADHFNRSTARRQKWRTSAVSADPVFSEAINAAERLGQLCLKLVNAAVKPANDDDVAPKALSSLFKAGSTEQQLWLRLELLKIAAAAGVSTISSCNQLWKWSDPAFNIRPLKTKSITSGHPIFGPIVREIKHLVRPASNGQTATSIAVIRSRLSLEQLAEFKAISASTPHDTPLHETHRTSPTQPNIHAFINEVRKKLAADGYAESTINNYSLAFSSCCGFAARKGLHLLSNHAAAADIEAMVTAWNCDRPATMKPSSASKRLQALRGFVTAYAAVCVTASVPSKASTDDAEADFTPCISPAAIEAIQRATRANVVRAPRAGPKPIPEEQLLIELLIAARLTSHPHRNAAIILIALCSTLRVSELGPVFI